MISAGSGYRLASLKRVPAIAIFWTVPVLVGFTADVTAPSVAAASLRKSAVEEPLYGEVVMDTAREMRASSPRA
jgi:hypothetical protein